MKRLLLFPCLLSAMLLMSGHGNNAHSKGINPPQIIDSIIVYSAQEKSSDNVFNSINDLRRHIDSLNHMSALTYQLALESRRSDSVTHAMLGVTIERNRLKDENKSLSTALDILKKFPDYLMLLMLIVAGSLIGQGIMNWYINWKNHD